MSNENKQSISVSYQRTNPVALDGTCVFDTLAEACIYVCKKDTTAYPGQIISVKDDIENTYVVTQAPDGELNLDLYDFDVYYAMSLLYPDNLYVPSVGTTELNVTLSGQYIQIPSTVKKLTTVGRANKFVSKYFVPTSVRTIGGNAFANSTFKQIIIPPRVTDIGANCFSDLVYLKEVNILADIPVIKSGTFNMCTRLETVKLPESVTRIADGAFYGCSSLENFTIPESVISIGEDTFTGCTKLVEVASNNNISYVDNWVVGGTEPQNMGSGILFDYSLKSGTVGIASCGLRGLSMDNVMIPNVTLPKSLRYISPYAFQGTQLEGIIFTNKEGWQISVDRVSWENVDIKTSDVTSMLTSSHLEYYWRRIDQ